MCAHGVTCSKTRSLKGLITEQAPAACVPRSQPVHSMRAPIGAICRPISSWKYCPVMDKLSAMRSTAGGKFFSFFSNRTGRFPPKGLYFAQRQYVRVREPDNTHGQTWMDRDRPAVRDSDLGRRDWTALFQGKRRFDRRGYATLALQP